jgi:hypothetical protein
VVAIAVDKNAPFSRIYLANTARDAVVGQAKNRSPVHLLTRFRTRPHEMFRLEVGGFTSLCLVLVGLGWSCSEWLNCSCSAAQQTSQYRHSSATANAISPSRSPRQTHYPVPVLRPANAL